MGAEPWHLGCALLLAQATSRELGGQQSGLEAVPVWVTGAAGSGSAPLPATVHCGLFEAPRAFSAVASFLISIAISSVVASLFSHPDTARLSHVLWCQSLFSCICDLCFLAPSGVALLSCSRGVSVPSPWACRPLPDVGLHVLSPGLVSVERFLRCIELFSLLSSHWPVCALLEAYSEVIVHLVVCF